MEKRRPVIGITSSKVLHNKLPSVHLNARYYESIEEAGGTPVVIPIGDDEMAEAWAALCDGILLSGGEDIDPSGYGEQLHPLTGATSKERDETELALIRMAKEKKIPLLAICRGAQLLNVALGGTLIQDIGSEIKGSLEHKQIKPRPEPSHKVKLLEGSRLYEILDGPDIEVNSMHHQTIGKLGEGMKAVGTAPDSISEAFEVTDPDWKVLAVQWHPEEMASADERMRRLFEAFIEDCR
ncbi:gamma-glutamyl-gamma-aminobutyrate hydrolase family protein [Metabacillus sp. RGM 3146]|uniref:gamma-glutamyl-gamma-aminobutyrate hydrolase family protein n=1 Tax=Metabacillus sp. RGM 3146 TaxID=3401092 RepID=UPI003B9CFCDF